MGTVHSNEFNFHLDFCFFQFKNMLKLGAQLMSSLRSGISEALEQNRYRSWVNSTSTKAEAALEIFKNNPIKKDADVSQETAAERSPTISRKNGSKDTVNSSDSEKNDSSESKNNQNNESNSSIKTTTVSQRRLGVIQQTAIMTNSDRLEHAPRMKLLAEALHPLFQALENDGALIEPIYIGNESQVTRLRATLLAIWAET